MTTTLTQEKWALNTSETLNMFKEESDSKSSPGTKKSSISVMTKRKPSEATKTPVNIDIKEVELPVKPVRQPSSNPTTNRNAESSRKKVFKGYRSNNRNRLKTLNTNSSYLTSQDKKMISLNPKKANNIEEYLSHQ